MKEEEHGDLIRAVGDAKARYGLAGIYTGAMASVYQKTRVEEVCRDLGLECASPLWGVDPEIHLHMLVVDGFSVMMLGVFALGMYQSWLGRVLDEESICELVALGKRYKFHVGLEGGEGETFVTDAPLFSKRIEVRSATRHWRGDSGYLEISDAVLVPKPRPKAPGAWSQGPGQLSSSGRS